MVRKKTHEEFVTEVFEKVGNEYSVIGQYVDTDTIINMKHNICGVEYRIRPHSFLSGKTCVNCKKRDK